MSPEAIEAHVERIKVDNRIGDLVYLIPGPPDADGKQYRSTRIDGINLKACFAQQPPVGAKLLRRRRSCQRGKDDKWFADLQYIAPDGSLWSVPNVWYNQPYACRLDYLRGCVTREHKREKFITQELACLRMRDKDRHTAALILEAAAILGSIPKQVARLNAAIENIEKHAQLDVCPALQPPLPSTT